MATTPSTQVLCNADALSRAADAILARGEALTKNAILNAMAAAIAGPGHDWGYIKNAAGGRALQPGLELPESPEPESSDSLAGRKVWVLHYDERDDWGSAPMLFPSKAATLTYVAEDYTTWRHADHPFEKVMKQLSETGEYSFESDDDSDDLDEEGSPAHQIWIQEVAIAPDVEDSADPADNPEALDKACPMLIVTDFAEEFGRDQDLGWETIFEDSDAMQTAAREKDIPLSDLSDKVHFARDCKIVASFRAEADFRKHIIEVDPQGETEWEIHAHELQPEQDYLDYLKDSRNAPRWVKDWVGPFTIKLDITSPEKAS